MHGSRYTETQNGSRLLQYTHSRRDPHVQVHWCKEKVHSRLSRDMVRTINGTAPTLCALFSLSVCNVAMMSRTKMTMTDRKSRVPMTASELVHWNTVVLSVVVDRGVHTSSSSQQTTWPLTDSTNTAITSILRHRRDDISQRSVWTGLARDQSQCVIYHSYTTYVYSCNIFSSTDNGTVLYSRSAFVTYCAEYCLQKDIYGLVLVVNHNVEHMVTECTHNCPWVQLKPPTYAHVHAYTFTCSALNNYTHTSSMHTYTRMREHTCIGNHTHIYVCAHMCTHVCTHTHHTVRIKTTNTAQQYNISIHAHINCITPNVPALLDSKLTPNSHKNR